MMKKSLCYSAITLAVTLVIGQILLILFSEGNSIGSSVLFILMNLTPMFVAIAFAKADGRKAVLKDMFLQRESIYSYILAIGSVCVYYGVSFIMGNISLTGGTIISVLVYMPWTILQGGLEECGWRWYLQPKFNIKSYVLKMFLISIVWFLWHITICITKISTFLILCDLAVCLATLYVSFSLVFALMRYLQGKVFLIRFYSPTTLSSSRAEFRLPSRLACA